MYRVLDHHQVPVAGRPLRGSQQGAATRPRRLPPRHAHRPDIARKHHVSAASVGNIALKAGLTLGRRYAGDELVEMIVRWFAGEELGERDRQAITRVGGHTAHPDLRSLVDVDPVHGLEGAAAVADVLAVEGSRRDA